MTSDEIIEFANKYTRKDEVDAFDIYHSSRGPCVERLHIALDVEPTQNYENPEHLDDRKMLQATEALAYVFYFEHGRPIDGDESKFKETLLALWPDYAPPMAMSFGSAGTIELDDYVLELPLQDLERDVILAILRAKFPEFVDWLHQWLPSQ